MNKLKIILQGGGTKCAYQMAFLNKLINHNLYDIESVYGTSFGALVGYFYCIRRLDILHNFFTTLNSNSLIPHFDFYGYGKYLIQIPLFGYLFKLIMEVIWLLRGIQSKGLYNQKLSISDLFLIDLSDEQKNNLSKFYCCVYNITKQRIEYINGSHPLIQDYISASSSLWIVFEPKLIQQLKSECVCDDTCQCDKTNSNSNSISNEYCTCNMENHKFNEYMDGGILKPIPYEHDETYHGKYLILSTKNIHHIKNKKFIFNKSGNHIFEYLDNIITFLVDYHQHLDIEYINKDWHERDNITLINYTPETDDPTNIDQKIIQKYIQDGEQLADEYISNINK